MSSFFSEHVVCMHAHFSKHIFV